MADLTLDTTLNITLLIIAIIILVLPLFFNGFQNKVEVKDRRGRILRVDLKGLNTKGKILISLCILSLAGSIWKAIRDDKAKNKLESIQNESRNTISSLNNKADSMSRLLGLYNNDFDTLKKTSMRMIKNDSLIFDKIILSLHSKNLGLDKNFNVIQQNNNSSDFIRMGNGAKIGKLELYGNSVNFVRK